MGKVTFYHESALPKGVIIPDQHRPSADVGEVGENHRLNGTDNNYFAVHKNKVIGHVGIKDSPDDHSGPVINAAYVDTEHSGKGVGASLYSHVLSNEPNVSSDNSREPGANAIWNKLKEKHPEKVSYDKKSNRFTWNDKKINKSETSDNQNSKMVFCAIDADDAGKKVGRAILADDVEGLRTISQRIDHGQEIVSDWAKENGGTRVSFGGDEGTIYIPAEALDSIEQLRADYSFAIGLTITVGVGSSLSEAGKALMVGKVTGKNKTVIYDESVEKQYKESESRAEDGTASGEEKKIGDSYMKKDVKDHDHKEDDCEYCKEIDKGEDSSEDGSSEDDAEHNDCQYCREAEENKDNKDDCEYCNEVEPEHDCKYCRETEENSNDDQDQKESVQDPSEADGTSNDSMENVLDQLEEEGSSPDSPEKIAEQFEDSDVHGDEMEDNVSRTGDYRSNTPSDMGLSEDEEEEEDDGAPDLREVLQGGLDSHADNIQKEKVVSLVSQALEGFKANKQILEKAREQAPDFYNASLSMLKAMIEMAQMLGLSQNSESPESEESNPKNNSPSAPLAPPKKESPSKEDPQDPKPVRQ